MDNPSLFKRLKKSRKRKHEEMQPDQENKESASPEPKTKRRKTKRRKITKSRAKTKNTNKHKKSEKKKKRKKKKKKKSSKREEDVSDSDSSKPIDSNISIGEPYHKLIACLQDATDYNNYINNYYHNQKSQIPIHSNISMEETYDKLIACLQDATNYNKNISNIYRDKHLMEAECAKKTVKIGHHLGAEEMNRIIDLSIDTDEDESDVIMEQNDDYVPKEIMELMEECKQRNKQNTNLMLQQHNEEKEGCLETEGNALNSLTDLYYDELPQADKELIAKIFECKEQEVVSRHHRSNSIVTVKDLKTLREGVWLNDEVINDYMALLQDKSVKNVRDDKKNICVLYLNSYNYQAVERWTTTAKLAKKGLNISNIFDVDKVIFPVNVRNVHWYCGCINFMEKKFECYCSKNGASFNNNFFRMIRKYVMDESDKNNNNLSLNDWTNDDHHDRYPQQENADDCGVFTSTCAKSICLNQSTNHYKQQNMPYLREKMTIEIICGEIMDTNVDP